MLYDWTNIVTKLGFKEIFIVSFFQKDKYISPEDKNFSSV